MECTLMHKNVPVMDMEILSETGRIIKLDKPQNPEHVPLGTLAKDGVSLREIDDWWAGRAIPASRNGIREALHNLGVSSPLLLIEKCYGLSLSDHYWFRPKGAEIKWENVNFFQNDFSKDVGEILFGQAPEDMKNISLMTPDNTSDGQLKKKWIIADGKRLLMKGANSEHDYRQEPFNEVIASAILQRLNISHVEYSLTFERGEPYSLCENFLTTDTELVTAWSVYNTYRIDNGDSELTHLLRCCDRLEIPGVREAIDRMLTVDYIIANRDRHYSNFGFVRDVNTLEWKGFSPIFDSGSSLWHNTGFVGRETGCRPFEDKHEEQIKLVSDLSWFDYGALNGIEAECMEILGRSKVIDRTRSEQIARAVAERCERIERMREQYARQTAVRSTSKAMGHSRHKHGNLYWNALNKRIGVRYEDGTENDGLHCGTTMQAFLRSRELVNKGLITKREGMRMAGKWVDTRLEADENGEWYLVDVYDPGQIPEQQHVRFDI